MTGYKLSKLVNEVLREMGLKEIPPQMIYNYIKKGFIPSTLGRVSEEDANEWITKYTTSKLEKNTNTNNEETTTTEV